MIHLLDDLRGGFEVEADVVVVGSGAGGAVAAANLAEAGLRTVVLEAGPVVSAREMTRDAPTFMARYFWEGGLRLITGTTQINTMQGRCLGGSTVMNSAIMMPLPGWLRDIWADDSGVGWLGRDPTGPGDLDRAFERIMRRTHVTPTPLSAQGRRNLLVRDALRATGLGEGKPLPRAVKDCAGCGDCITGCATGQKQSVDRSWLPDAVRDGATIYTCSAVDRVLTEGGRAIGVTGAVIDPRGRRPLARFTVRAPRVVMAAGVMSTPTILLGSGLHGGRLVGRSFSAHIGAGAVGIMEERVDPWVGASQGWGLIHPTRQGMKYESLWAASSLMAARWGGVGPTFTEEMQDMKHATVAALIYRPRGARGRVRRRRDGTPAPQMWIPHSDIRAVMEGVKPLVEGLLAIGARYVTTGIAGVPRQIRTKADVEQLLSPRIKANCLSMTANHPCGSAPLAAHPKRGPVDPDGRLRGVDGVWVADASLFPSPSAVNPQAAIMAMADVITRRLGELPT